MTPPPATVSSNDRQYIQNFQRMHLSDISENDTVQHMSSNNPKENLLELTCRVSNEELRHAICSEIKRLTTDYERMINMLQQRSDAIQDEYEHLHMTEDNYQRKYEKAVREMQFFKKKYEKAAELNRHYANGRPRSPSVDSSGSSLLLDHRMAVQPALYHSSIPQSPPPSSLSGSENTNATMYSALPPPPPLPTSPLPSTSTTVPGIDKLRHMSRSSSSSTSSSNASGSPYWTSMPSELSPAPPVPRLRRNSNVGGVASSIHSGSTDNESKAGSILQGRQGSWQQMAGPVPAVTSHQPNVTRSGTLVSALNPQIIQQRKVDPITFGGSDALWETITKSKTSDVAIEKLISNFLRRGGSPNTAKQSTSHKTVKYGYGMLHALITIKAPQSIALLLSHGANPNALTLSQVEEDKVTPAYLAASMGWLSGLETLIEAGADITLARGAGLKNKTALHVAAEHCHTAIVEYIVSLSPPKYHLQVDSMGATALHYAAASGHTDLVSFFIQQCQLPVNLADIRGETPLHWASKNGHLEVASFLIERCGSDYNAYIPRKLGTPYDLAKSGGHKRLMEYYKKIGALTAKKMDKKREEDRLKNVPVHLESTLAKNGLFGF